MPAKAESCFTMRKSAQSVDPLGVRRAVHRGGQHLAIDGLGSSKDHRVQTQRVMEFDSIETVKSG